ncbi:MAG TPA: TetR family transcriptional regulator [Jiangellaceae bacterium]
MADIDGRPRRSDATRRAILLAARVRFASDGYDRATIRAIAADARIDPAMVMRYFGSKARLFAAAVDPDLRLPDLSSVPRRRLGKVLVAHFLDRWEGDPGDDSLLMLLRSAATDDVARERMRHTFASQLTPVLAAIGGGSDEVAGPDEVAERAGLVASQLLGLALTRHILRLPPVVAMDRDSLVERVGPTIQRYLTG